MLTELFPVITQTRAEHPAPLMTTIAELGSFLAREQSAAAVAQGLTGPVLTPDGGGKPVPAAANGAAVAGAV